MNKLYQSLTTQETCDKHYQPFALMLALTLYALFSVKKGTHMTD